MQVQAKCIGRCICRRRCRLGGAELAAQPCEASTVVINCRPLHVVSPTSWMDWGWDGMALDGAVTGTWEIKTRRLSRAVRVVDPSIPILLGGCCRLLVYLSAHLGLLFVIIMPCAHAFVPRSRLGFFGPHVTYVQCTYMCQT